MEVLDQVKEKVETVVTEVKGNVSEVQGKVEQQYGKVLETAKSEYAHQTTTLKGYQERISAKFAKHFNREEIIADIKEEIEFFTNEFKSGLERLKSSFSK